MGSIAMILVVYFLPSIIGGIRGIRTWGVFATNLLFGWTGVGWLVTFIWAFTAITTIEYEHKYGNTTDTKEVDEYIKYKLNK